MQAGVEGQISGADYADLTDTPSTSQMTEEAPKPVTMALAFSTAVETGLK